jgi:hypothetical protein
VVRILPTYQGFDVFDKGNEEDQGGTKEADHKHAFEDSHQEHAEQGDHDEPWYPIGARENNVCSWSRRRGI